MKMKKILAAVLAGVMALSATACSSSSTKKIESPDDFAGAKISVQTGTTAHDQGEPSADQWWLIGTVSSTYPAAEAAKLPVPSLGVVDAAAREAAFATRNRRIGVIGTAATIRSRSYEKLLRQLVPGVEITAQACPLFVPLVEAGYVDHSEESRQQVTKLVIAQYLTEVREAGVDTLILGCTHYPLLKTMIGEFMGQSVTLVDPAKTAAHHLEQMLSERGLRAAQEHEGQAHFYVSDVPDSFVQTADLFLGEYKGGPVDQIAIDKY